jgi:hypothetical protein
MESKERYFDSGDELTPLIRRGRGAETRDQDRLVVVALWSCVLLPVGLLLFLIFGYAVEHVNIEIPQPTAIAIIGTFHRRGFSVEPLLIAWIRCRPWRRGSGI